MAKSIDGIIQDVFPTYALVRAIVDKVTKTNVDADAKDDLSSVRVETERQENEMRRLEAQAKVAQEMAIASRIERAAEVEIEEFYEYAGEGKAGLNLEDKTLALGVSGAGKRVSKRVYRFTGMLQVNDRHDAADEGKELS